MAATPSGAPSRTRLAGFKQLLGRWRLLKEGRPFLLLLSFLVGAAAGGLAIAFRAVAGAARAWGEGGAAGLHPSAGHLLPVGAGLIFALVLARAPILRGRGFSGIMQAVFRDRGHLSLNNGLRRLGLSVISVAGHGSVGRESMIAHASAAIGSYLGRTFHLAPRKITRIIASAAAASIAATYGAPIAGILFTLELLVEEVHLTLGPMIIAALGATLVSGWAGAGGGFSFPAWDAPSLEELPWFMVLGVVAGVAASLYASVVRRLEKARPGGKWSPLFAGVAIALASVWFPRLLGGGYEAMDSMWALPPDAGEAAAYVAGKALLTALCIAAGWVGGHFGPSISMGVAVGFLVLAIQGGTGLALPIAGGAAMAAAVTHAPMALLVLVYETTAAPGSFLPTGLAVVMAIVTYDALQRRSVYESPLEGQGHPHPEMAVPHPERLVGEVMDMEVTSVDIEGTLGDLLTALRSGKQRAFPVMREGRFVGLITRTDLLHALHPRGSAALSPAALNLPLARWMVVPPDLLVAHEEETVLEAAARMTLTGHGIGQLPVVDKERPDRLLGMLSREAVLAGISARQAPHPRP